MFDQQVINALLSMASPDATGYTNTLLPQVKLYTFSEYQAACPLLYDSGLFFVLQGKKRGQVAGQQFATSPEHFLVLSNTMPVECETLARPESPMVGLYVAFDREEVSRQVHLMQNNEKTANMALDKLDLKVVTHLPMTTQLVSSVSALAERLGDDIGLNILGPGLLAQIYYEVLAHPVGFSILKQWVSADGKFSAIAQAIEYMQTHLVKRLSVDELAMQVGLSVSAFHHHFKQVTGISPLQYLKQLRLVRAKDLLVQQKQSASQAAYDVGYESPNQFSREFKRYFGVPPSQAHSLPYS